MTTSTKIARTAPLRTAHPLQPVERLAHDSLARAQQASKAVRQQMARATTRTRKTIRAQPVTSVLVAAAVGMVGAGLLAWAGRSRSSANGKA